MVKMTSLTPQPKTLNPVWPNAGIRDWYHARLEDEVDMMTRSFEYWLKAEYRKTGLASDALPAIAMKWALRKLVKKWQQHFDRMSDDLADTFVGRVMSAGDAALRRQLRREGMSVKFQMTESMRSAYAAVVEENVNLIRDLPSKYGTQLTTEVMISVSRGRDMGYLAHQLEHQMGVCKRRAAFIAQDQNEKATSVLQAQRQMDLGITEGVWRHSHAGKVPRPSHVAADNERFKLAEGKLIDGEMIMPGQKPRCRCTWRSVIPGL